MAGILNRRLWHGSEKKYVFVLSMYMRISFLLNFGIQWMKASLGNFSKNLLTVLMKMVYG